MHEINVTGYNAATEEKSLNLGTAASYGVEKLHITFDAAWDDLSKSATFNCGKPGRGLRPVTRMIDENGIVDVPQEATAVATKDGTITLLGVAPGSGQRISVDIPYTVTGHAAVPSLPSSRLTRRENLPSLPKVQPIQPLRPRQMQWMPRQLPKMRRTKL